MRHLRSNRATEIRNAKIIFRIFEVLWLSASSLLVQQGRPILPSFVNFISLNFNYYKLENIRLIKFTANPMTTALLAYARYLCMWLIYCCILLDLVLKPLTVFLMLTKLGFAIPINTPQDKKNYTWRTFNKEPLTFKVLGRSWFQLFNCVGYLASTEGGFKSDYKCSIAIHRGPSSF